MDLPPDVKELNGQYYREMEMGAEDGSTRIKRRPVSLDPQEARARRMDYYHPVLGWLLEGYKLAKDRAVESIMADTSMSIPLSVEDQEKKRAKALA